MEDHHVDRPGVEAWRHAKLTGTNRSFGLIAPISQCPRPPVPPPCGPRRIPDSTSLEKVTISEGSVVLIGQSQQASALVGLLQGSPLIRRPTLTGSVQTDPRTGKERFTLTAVVAGSTKEKEADDAAAVR